MEKSEVIQKSYIIKFYIFTGENIKYALYFINIFLYFTTLYIIKVTSCCYIRFVHNILEGFKRFKDVPIFKN